MKALLHIVLLSLLLDPTYALAGPPENWFEQGKQHQTDHRTTEAIAAYQKALELKPDFAQAHYEIGWSYWVLNDWDQVVRHWRRAKALGWQDTDFDTWLGAATRNLEGNQEPLTHTIIGTTSTSQPGSGDPPLLELIGRFQHYNPKPQHRLDKFDRYVFSPKSVRFSSDGSKAWVNALEGYVTIVFDPASLKRKKVIVHKFSNKHQPLFAADNSVPPWYPMPSEFAGRANVFNGKPVESELSHNGKYLWVPYYRRDYDRLGVLPSALALIDAEQDRILRLFQTGPIPKYVVASPDSRWLAVIHWGDNTVGLIDTSDPDYRNFRRDKLITIGHRIALDKIDTTDRDHGCGFCLRGSVFTPDGRYLLVGRMGGGGIAVIDVANKRYLGTVKGMRPTPRHLVVSPDGKMLYMSASFAGYVVAYRLEDLIDAARNRRKTLAPLREQRTGSATRTIALSPDGRIIFAAVNRESKIVALSAPELTPLATIPTDSFPVGMAVSPDGTQLWVTAQGRKRRGGNSVSVYRIRPSS